MNKFENEYRDLIQEDMPDLWDRIEAGLVEKPVEVGMLDKQEIQTEKIDQQKEGTQEVNYKTVKEKSKIRQFVRHIATYRVAGSATFASVMAVCILLAVVMPTALGMLATGGASEAAKSAQNDMAAAEAPAAAMPESALESAKMETPATEGAAMEAAPMEGAAAMEDALEEGIREEAELTEGIAEPAASKTEAKASKKIALEDGTIIENLQVSILEIENMNYHTIYRACVELDETGTFQTGDVVEFISMNVTTQENESNNIAQNGEVNETNKEEQVDGIMVGGTITVTLSYDAEADISLHLIQ